MEIAYWSGSSKFQILFFKSNLI